MPFIEFKNDDNGDPILIEAHAVVAAAPIGEKATSLTLINGDTFFIKGTLADVRKLLDGATK